MKRTAIIFAIIFGIGILNSCEEDKDHVLDMSEAVAPQFTNPEHGSAYILEEENEAELLFTFQWSDAEYKAEGLPDVRYLMQAVKTSNGWENPDSIIDIVETRETNHEMTVRGLNRIAFNRLNIPAFETDEISFRLMAFLTRANTQTWLFSEPLDITVTTYESVGEASILNVPGSYQGWDPGNNQTVVYSPEDDDLYEGYLFFEEDDTEYKFAKGSWDVNWGDDDADGNLQPDGANIIAELAGVYRINADLNEFTHTQFRTEWALIGSAAEGWDTDVPMEVDLEYWEENWKVRYVITLDLEPGHFKFRANGAWDPPAGLNMGIDEDAEEGVLMYGGFGNDIPIDEAGTYTVILDLTGPVYRYELHKE